MSHPTPAAIMQIGTGFMGSKTLLSAVELGVFSTLANGPADLPTLQQKLGLHQRSACDFLDALVALNLLERRDGVYSNTVETDLFLDKRSHLMWAAFSRWRVCGCTVFGARSPRRSDLANSKMKARAGMTSSQRCTPHRRGCATFCAQ